MIKKTLKLTLCALLLGAGVTALADGPVTLGDGKTTVTWEEFANVINGGTPTGTETDTPWGAYQAALATQKTAQQAVDAQQLKVDAAQQAYDTEYAKIKGLTDALSRVQPQTKIPKYTDYDWFVEQRNAYNTVLDYVTNLTGTEPNVEYYITAGLSKVLYLSFNGETPSKPANTEKATWQTVKISKFYTDVIESTTKFTAVKVFLGYAEDSTEAAPKYNYTNGTDGYMSVSGYSSSDKEGVFDAIASTFETMAMQDASSTPVPTTEYINAKTALENQEGIVDQKLADLNAAKAALVPLQKALDDANTAVETTKEQMEIAYQIVSLNGNVEATTAITANDYKGTITGNGFVINVGTTSALFNKFTGQLSNAAINGSFASSFVGATFDNVAVNNGSAYRFYDDQGNANTNTITSLGMLGFVARNYFGVDFANNKLAKKEANTIVYDITVYEPNKTTQNYVVKNVEDEVTTLIGKGGAAVTIPANMFAKSATSDLKGINNVFYVDGGANVCDNVVITGNKVNEQIPSFYCPEDITATELTYTRALKGGQMNSVCLPFALEKTADMEALCTYDRETTEGFVFTYVENEVPANTPMLVKPKAAMDNMKLSNVQLNQTSSKQITDATGNFLSESACYGTFKVAGVGEFAGGSNAGKVYGLRGDDFQAAGTTATFAPFRIAIVSYTTTNAPRRIIIKTMEGTDITDTVMGDTSGVKDAVAEAPAFNVAGGQGEIVITSDVDYGKVVVYNAEGKAVDAATVVAGTTTINVQKGLYIVMGKKVMVK